jgi:CHASE3 domain sensor protein
METLDPLLLCLFVLGVASTITVFVVAFQQIDRTEKQRAQVNRMRGRLNRLLQQRP